MSNMNPLSQYTKNPIKFTRLVSNNKIPYKPGVLKNPDDELGICARSARDELLFNNPDALMNGKAVKNVIENCVPDVLNADELYLPDVELLLLGIKLATKETTYEIETPCPACSKYGMFERDVNYLFETANLIKEEPTLVLENGLVLYLKPHTWKQHTEFSTDAFQQNKMMQHADKVESDEEKIKLISTIFDNMAKLQFAMLTEFISRIELPDDITVTDRKHINEWAENLDKHTIDEITKAAFDMNMNGVEHNMDVQCSECGHEWTIENLQFDPSSFFVQGFSRKTTKK